MNFIGKYSNKWHILYIFLNVFRRALQKKVRAEEMLKASSLPPSMAKREKDKPKSCICPRSFRDLGLEENVKPKNHFLSVEKEFEELRDEFLRSSPKPNKVKKRNDKRVRIFFTINMNYSFILLIPTKPLSYLR